MGRLAVHVIIDYISNLKDPRTARNPWELTQRSYSKWAAETVLNEVIENPTKSPLDVVGDFVSRMNQYSLIRGDIMFSIAYDIGMDIFDTLYFTYRKG